MANARAYWLGPAGVGLSTPREMGSLKSWVETRAGSSEETDHAACKASRVAVQYREKVKKVQSNRQNRAVIDVQAGRGTADRVKQHRLRRRHPHLPATGEPVEQCGAAARVEVRRDLVE